MSRYCAKCGKAQVACICSFIKLITNQIEVVILQHPSEVNQPLGSARILNLSLAHCQIFVGEDFSNHEQLNRMLSEPNVNNLVLYPTEQAQLLDDLAFLSSNIDTAKDVIDPIVASSVAASTYKTRLILLDGTWKKAYKMWMLSTNLHSLISVKLADSLQGNYQIRKSPSSNSLATVEAGFHALCLLEPSIDFSPLISAFKQMIDFQISQMPAGVFERNYR